MESAAERRSRKRSERAARWARNPDVERAKAHTKYLRHADYFAGYGKAHREERRLATEQWKDRTGMTPRALHLRQKYGITVARYDQLLAAQGGVCAICKRPETAVDKRNGLPRSLAVDHDHSTGQIRGLLCTKCNSGVGYMRDRPDLCRSAAQYLESAHAAR